MTNDTTTTVTPKQREMLTFLIRAHKYGHHRGKPRIGCPSCVFGGALDQDGGEG